MPESISLVAVMNQDEIFADRVKSEPRCDGATIVFSGNLLKFSHNLHYSS